MYMNVAAGPGTSNQDSKNIAMLIWILTIFFWFIPGLIFYLVKKDDQYVQDQAKEALNWSITFIIIHVAGTILATVYIGYLLITAAWIIQLVFCIMGAVATSNGKGFRCPFALRLIK